MQHELQTMAIAYQEILAGKSPWIPLGTFSHDFFGNYVDRREELISDPIQVPATGTTDQHKWAAFCAASIDYLCQKYSIACPDWVKDPCYILAEPWYYSRAAHKPDIRERLIEETPEPFTKRNTYCGDHVWANKYEAAADYQLRQSA